VAVYEFPDLIRPAADVAAGRDDPGEPTYNIAWALWLDGALEVSAAAAAWDAALIRHEALRTTFRNSSGVPVQGHRRRAGPRSRCWSPPSSSCRGRAGAPP